MKRADHLPPGFFFVVVACRTSENELRWGEYVDGARAVVLIARLYGLVGATSRGTWGAANSGQRVVLGGLARRAGFPLVPCNGSWVAFDSADPPNSTGSWTLVAGVVR